MNPHPFQKRFFLYEWCLVFISAKYLPKTFKGILDFGVSLAIMLSRRYEAYVAQVEVWTLIRKRWTERQNLQITFF